MSPKSIKIYLHAHVPVCRMKTQAFILLAFLLCTLEACNTKNNFYCGADLSYANEMLDCGGTYRAEGQAVNPYELFAQKGCNLVRIRLWHTPKQNAYSGFEDVKRAITQAKLNKMSVLLDFHYSDTWADPQKQQIPAAWKGITDLKTLGDSIYNYTLSTLMKLHAEDLFPEMVQVGNETNIEILQPDSISHKSINWRRNAYLLNQAIYAVHKAEELSKLNTGIMLHIAQPENALWWFKLAHVHGVIGFDWIGLSYYPKWSTTKMEDLPKALDSLKKTYKKQLMIVETAYPNTLAEADSANNILGKDALLPAYPATPEGQLNYLTDLVTICKNADCEGVIYWEPAWISTNCRTPWGKGSHWDNATFFDAAKNNEALPAFQFFNLK